MIEDKIVLIKSDLKKLKEGITTMATVLETITELAASLTLGIDEVATDIQALKDALAGAGTPEEVEAILQPIVDRLIVLGQGQ